MKVGICCAGIGPASTGDFIRRSAQAAERCGFSSYWFPEHVLLFDAYPESKYPYAGLFGGDVPLPDPRIDFCDPLMGMAWAAAATQSIEIGSGILILPQRNPVVLAKELASLDEFSGGRIALGVGVGWCKEEYDAIGADWPGRGRRTDEHIDVLRTLWRNDQAEFQGETVSFKHAYMNPKPPRNGDIPIVIGGESDVALKRVARAGDGWLAFKLPIEEAPSRIALLKQLTREQGRDPEALRIMCPIIHSTTDDDLNRFRDAGGNEFYLVMSAQMPIEETELNARMAELGERFVAKVKDW